LVERSGFVGVSGLGAGFVEVESGSFAGSTGGFPASAAFAGGVAGFTDSGVAGGGTLPVSLFGFVSAPVCLTSGFLSSPPAKYIAAATRIPRPTTTIATVFNDDPPPPEP